MRMAAVPTACEREVLREVHAVKRQQIGIKIRRVILALRTSGVYPLGIGNPLNVCAQT